MSLRPLRTPHHRPGRLALVAIATGVAAWLLTCAAIRVVYVDRVLPGARVGALPAGGLGVPEAAGRFARLAPPAREVVLIDGGRRRSVRSDDAGLRVDPDRSAARALASGRRGVLDFLLTPISVVSTRDVQPAYAVDRRAVARAVAAFARTVDVPVHLGTLTVDPATLATAVGPPRAGRAVRRRATVAATAGALLRGAPSRIRVPVARRPPPSRRAVEGIADEARAYLAAGGMRLTGAGAPIDVSPSAVAPILRIESRPSAEGGGIRLGVERRAALALLERLLPRRERPPREARIQADAAPVILDDKGALSWRPRRASVQIRPAREGRSIDRRRALRALIDAVRRASHDVSLPVRRIRPTLTNATARRVRRLIGTFTTQYSCCEPRAKNIRLIARAVDGVLVLPGQRFSLNDAAGERTRKRGFLPAPFISDGKIVPSVGGGVSQFSTTMYNAAYFAGLRLDAHQPHSFYIDRYPAGREATLDFDSIDLVWTNDTQAPVFIRATSTATSVTVSLYGDNGDRRVRAEVGERQPVQDRDFSITVTRVIRRPDGRVAREPFVTTYDEPPEPE